MKLLLCYTALTLFFVGGLSAQKSTPLFNGKNFKGWYGFTAVAGKTDASKLFSIKDGVIVMNGKDAGYVITNKSYKKFELTLEFKWETALGEEYAKRKRNSGVMYYVPSVQKDTLWPKGIQYQIKDNATGDFVMLQQTTIRVNDSINQPGKSTVIKHFTEAEKPLGEWNQLKIVVDQATCSQFLNGVLVNKGENPSVTQGRILLQYEGYPISFRNVLLKKL